MRLFIVTTRRFIIACFIFALICIFIESFSKWGWHYSCLEVWNWTNSDRAFLAFCIVVFYLGLLSFTKGDLLDKEIIDVSRDLNKLCN